MTQVRWMAAAGAMALLALLAAWHTVLPAIRRAPSLSDSPRTSMLPPPQRHAGPSRDTTSAQEGQTTTPPTIPAPSATDVDGDSSDPSSSDAGDSQGASQGSSDGTASDPEHRRHSGGRGTLPGGGVVPQMGASLDRSATGLARLAAEYRALLLLGTALSEDDRYRMGLLDRLMAGIVRRDAQGAPEALALLEHEDFAAMSRYLGHLLRQGPNAGTMSAVETVAWTDPVPAHRVGAVAAMGPVLDVASVAALDRTLADPDREVRLEAARVLLESATSGAQRTNDWGWLSQRELAEQDAEVRALLAQGLDILQRVAAFH